MINKIIYHFQIPLILAAMLVSLSSCMSEEPSAPEMSGTTLSVQARIAKTAYTRSYQPEGPITNGKYYLTYPTPNNSFSVATVDFDQQGDQTPGLGIVTTSSGTELKWSEIGGSPVDLYLDNVAPPTTQDLDTTVTFTANWNPFVAAPFDSINGRNDLLWGTKQVYRDTKSVYFDLHHNMARARVQVQVVHLPNSIEDIDLSDAVVRLTNIYTTPKSYNRRSGTIKVDEETTGPVDLVNSESEWNDYYVTPGENGSSTKTYLSYDIVLPPQTLADNEKRPKLEIELPDGTIYSGILPHAMFIADEKGELNYPVNLEFLKEHILTIRTVVTEEPPALEFLPVWVIDWVDKGEFTLEAHQSGVYTANEFYRLIRYYRDNNEYQLQRYGSVKTEGNTQYWQFDFWSSVQLEYSQIFNMMQPGTGKPENGPSLNFQFNYNNYTIFVENGDSEEPKKVTPGELYQIVTGNLRWDNIP